MTKPKFDVFLSHNSVDKAWVSQLKADLEKYNLRAWLDKDEIRPGNLIVSDLEPALDNSRAMALVVTPAAVASGWVEEEYNRAVFLTKKKPNFRLVAVLYKDAELPGFLETRRWVDFRNPTTYDEQVWELVWGITGQKPPQILTLNSPNAQPPTPNYQLPITNYQTHPTYPSKLTLARLPNTGEHLIGRESELAQLDDAWADPQTHIFSLVAWGGVGKSTLTNHWLLQMEEDRYRGAGRVYAWSFYSQGAGPDRVVSADDFIDDALRWFGDHDPTGGTPWEKGRRLAGLVQQQPTLLILDGLEPLQYPPGPEEGKLADPAMQALLRELGHHNPGLCLISTRLAVTDLDRFQKRSAGRLNLEHLSPAAGAEYLRIQGVRGTEAERLEAGKAFAGHALALTLLGSYLNDAYEGDIRCWREIGPLEADIKHGGHARRVMQAYDRWLAADDSEVCRIALAILRLLGLFDRPAGPGSLAALRAAPPIPDLTEALFQDTDEHRLTQILDKKEKSVPSVSSVSPIPDRQWNQAVAMLRRARLLATPDSDARSQDHTLIHILDAHPLVREHFAAQLQTTAPDAWREGHDRLYQHLKSTAKDKPDTLAQMAPLFTAVAHGCRAGKHQEALDEVYWERISRKNEFFSTTKLGAFGSDLAALTNFFTEPWHKPVESLTDQLKAVLLSWTGFRLRALGRLAEARQPMQAGMEASIAQEDWNGAAQDACNLSELSLTIGEVVQAVDYARQSVDLADRSRDDFMRMANRTALADALHQVGRLDEAAAAFAEAEAMQKERNPAQPFLDSLGGFRYCDLLLSQGQFQAVQKRAGQTIEIAKRNNWLLDIAVDNLSLGRAYLAEAIDNGQLTIDNYQLSINQAVAGLRQAGYQDFLVRGLLARAEMYVFLQDWAGARQDLDEAMELATRSGMRLFECDGHLGYARLLVAMGRSGEEIGRGWREKIGDWQVDEDFDWLEKAREHVAEARRLVEETGYGRREGEVEELERLLENSSHVHPAINRRAIKQRPINRT